MSGGSWENVWFRLGHTTLDSLTSNINDNFSGDEQIVKVYDNYFNINGSAGDWIEVELDNTYSYNGTDNLILDVRWTGCSYYEAITWAYETPGYYHIVYEGTGIGTNLCEYGSRLRLEVEDTAIQTTSLGSIKDIFAE